MAWNFRGSRLEVFCKIGVLRNFTKSIGKHLCQSLFFNKAVGLRPATLLKKRLWHRCFPANFVKFLRTPFLTEHLWWLLLKFLFHTWLSHPQKPKSMLIGSRNNLQFVSGFSPSLVSVLVLQLVTTVHRMCQVSKTCYNTLISIMTNCFDGMSSERYISFMMLSTLWSTFEIIYEIINGVFFFHSSFMVSKIPSTFQVEK